MVSISNVNEKKLTYFGFVNEGLLAHVDSSEHNTLNRASAIAEVAVQNQPELRFQVWGRSLVKLHWI